VNAVIAGVLFQCLSPPGVVCAYQLTLSLSCAMTHFCVIVSFEYPCDMDHESDVNIKTVC